MKTESQDVCSNLERLIRAREFVVTGELGPPKGWQRSEVEKKAALLRGVGGRSQHHRQPDRHCSYVQHCRGACIGRTRVGTDRPDDLPRPQPSEHAKRFARRRRAGNPKCALPVGRSPEFRQSSHGEECIRSWTAFSWSRWWPACAATAFFSAAKRSKVAHRRSGWEPQPILLVIRLNSVPSVWQRKWLAGVNFIQTQLIYDLPRFKKFMERVVDMGLHEKVAILAGVGRSRARAWPNTCATKCRA